MCCGNRVMRKIERNPIMSSLESRLGVNGGVKETRRGNL